MVYRGRAAVLASLWLVLATVGCSAPSTSTSGTATAKPQAPTAAATRLVDLLRLSAIEDDFPAGSVVNRLTGPRKLDDAARASVGDLVSYGDSLTVDPGPCRVLLKPVDAKSGTETVSITSATGPQDPFIAVSVDDPVSVPSALPDEGCHHFTFAAKGPVGKVERLAAPMFDDAVTYALKVVFAWNGGPASLPLVEYFYTAILDGRTFVSLWARIPSEFAAEPALTDLLTKAVAALRG